MSILNKQNVQKFGLAAVVSTALASNANALDVTTALADSTADSNINTAALWILGISVGIFTARKVIGFFSR